MTEAHRLVSTDLSNIIREHLVTDPQEWPALRELGRRYTALNLERSNVTFYDYEPIEGATYNYSPLYIVTAWVGPKHNGDQP